METMYSNSQLSGTGCLSVCTYLNDNNRILKIDSVYIACAAIVRTTDSFG